MSGGLALAGAEVDSLVRMAAAAAVAVLGMLVLRRAPRLAFAGWLLVLCAAPVWVGIQVGVYFEPQVLMTLAVLAALFPLRRALPVRLSGADVLVLGFLGSALVPVALGGATLSAVFVLLVQWAGAYALGRLVVHRLSLAWVQGAIAVAFSVVAVLALVEFAVHWNPFVSLPGGGALHDAWSPIQDRGGLPRAEGAFGHSIALGGSLALALPITLAAPFRSGVRLAMALLMAAACAGTFSRIGLGTAALGIALSLIAARTSLPTRLRVVLTGGLVVVGAAVGPLLSRVFAAAGDEATGSAGYRRDLLELVGGIRPLGLSPLYARSPTGEVTYGAFRSIDNSLLLLGLTYGWIPLVCLLLALLLAVGAVLSRRATAPTIALVAQVPALVSVALITQYSGWLWFVAGLAVASQVLTAGDRRPVAGAAGDDPAGASARAGEQASPVLVNGPSAGSTAGYVRRRE
ncbi:hypothetical protein [Modestobacter sp. SYSU DS0290]